MSWEVTFKQSSMGLYTLADIAMETSDCRSPISPNIYVIYLMFSARTFTYKVLHTGCTDERNDLRVPSLTSMIK